MSNIFKMFKNMGIFPLTVIQNFGVQILNMMTSIFLSIVLARLLGPSDFGLFSLNYTLVNVVAIFVVIGLPAFLSREIAIFASRRDWHLANQKYVASIKIVLAASAIAVAVFLFLFFALPDFQRVVGGNVFFATLALLPVFSIMRVTGGALRGTQQVAKSQFLETIALPFFVLLGVASVYFSSSKGISASNVLLLFCISALCVFLLLRRELSKKIRIDGHATCKAVQLKELVRSSIPFSLIGAAAVLNSYTDIIMLSWYVSPDEVGIYRIASQGAVFIAFGLQIAQMIGAPVFAQLGSEGATAELNAVFGHTRLLSAGVAVFVFALFAWLGQPLIEFLFGSSFSAAYLPLVILGCGYLINASFGPVGILLSMCNQEGLVSRALWLLVAANVVFNFVLIPQFGMIGGAIATSITVALVHPFLWLIAKRKGII